MALKQTSSNKKRIFTKGVAVVLAGATLVGSSIGLAKLFGGRTNNGLDTGETTTGISQDIEVAGLVLTEDFDINSEDAVRKRANEIYNYSEKEYDVDTIVNIIYYMNGAYDKIIFPASEEKVAYLSKVIMGLELILDDNLLDDVEAQRNLFYENEGANVTPKSDQEIYAYMFMAKMDANPNSVDVSKQDAIRFAQIVNEHLNNVQNGMVDKFEETANEYYDFYKNLRNRTGKDEKPQVNAGYSALLYKDIDTKNILVTMFLDDSKNKELDGNYANSYVNLTLNDARTALGIDVQPLVDKMLEEGKDNKDLPPAYSEDNNKADEQNANNRPDYEENDGNTEMVDKGGDKITGGSGHEEIIGDEPTTSVTEEEIIVEVPNGGHHEEVIPGGDVVNEWTGVDVIDEGTFYADADEAVKNIKK